jgi:hypothetical protein
VIEDDAAPALGPFPIVGGLHRWFPLWFPEISNQDQYTV